jgi:hypothetical protein
LLEVEEKQREVSRGPERGVRKATHMPLKGTGSHQPRDHRAGKGDRHRMKDLQRCDLRLLGARICGCPARGSPCGRQQN